METGLLRALASTLVLPPAGPLLLVLLGLLFARRWRIGAALGLLGAVALWLLSCHAVAVELSRALLPLPAPVSLADLKQARVQAVVVLGGGVHPQAPEYGTPQPAPSTLIRLRYGVRLARTAGLPLAFAGGKGWAGNGQASEAEAVREVARQDFGLAPRWVDDQSRDTAENAVNTALLLQRDNVRRIALVTDAWHLPRAVRAFQRVGFEVLPAPTALPSQDDHWLIEWLPSSEGLRLSRQVLREWLALQMARY